MEEEINNGVHPSEIAFLAFTRAAANEAATRAATRFGLNPEEDLPWFRTIHSLVYRRLGITRDEIMGARDWEEFSQVIGESLGPPDANVEDLGIIHERHKGSTMLRIVDYSATTMQSLSDTYHDLREPVDYHELKRFDQAYTQYKVDSAKMDFTDMLLFFIREGEPIPVRVGIIDEAQDLTRSQWAAAEVALSGAERVYVGGDDDQAIYRWAGADIETFLSLSDHGTAEVLPISHRLPEIIHDLSQGITRRISSRYRKQFDHSSREGVLEYYWELDHIADTIINSTGSWMLLARNRYATRKMEDFVQYLGLPYRTRTGSAISEEHVRLINLWNKVRHSFGDPEESFSAQEFRDVCVASMAMIPTLRETEQYPVSQVRSWITERVSSQPWEQAFRWMHPVQRDYYSTLIRRKQSLTDTPRITIETIHGVKGAEADHVLLLPDMSSRTYQSYTKEPDHEHRVFYVGATRARESLHLISPHTQRYYPLISS